jgi:heme exporter protein B
VPKDWAVLLLWIVPLVTLLLSVIGAMGAALTVGIRRSAGLLGLLVVPLYIPVVVFAVAAVSGDDVQRIEACKFLVALLVIMIPVSLPVCATALRDAARR